MAKKQNKKVSDEAIGLDVTLNKSEAFIEKHFKTILIALAVIIAVVAGIFIYRSHRNNVEKEAVVAIAKSQEAFAANQFEQALNGDGATQKGFLKIINDYSGTQTANLAKYYAGLCYYNLDKTDDAIKMLEGFDPQDDMLVSPAAKGALADAYVKKGDKEKAIGLFLEAAKMADKRSEGGVNNSIAPLFMKKAAAIYEDLKQNEKALELYQQIKTRTASELSAEMDKYIERLTK